MIAVKVLLRKQFSVEFNVYNWQIRVRMAGEMLLFAEMPTTSVPRLIPNPTRKNCISMPSILPVSSIKHEPMHVVQVSSMLLV
jgi:hypothetical protein